jgi:hypothetical protein
MLGIPCATGRRRNPEGELMRDFLVALSGARPRVLAQCPSERAKFEGVGGAVLTTSVLATISMWFALYSALDVNPLLAVPAAVIWGLVILSLDRWLVSTIPAEGARRWRLALPRILMALLLGVVISTPLVLQIFRSEIDAQIVEIKQRRANAFLQDQQRGTVGQQVAAWRKSVDDLRKVISSNGDVPLDPASDPRIRSFTAQWDAEQKQVDKYYREWQCQLYGGAGCSRKGNGPLAEASKKAHDQARARVNELNDQIENRKKDLSAADTASKQVRLDQARAELPKAQAQFDAATRRQSDLQRSFDAENQADGGLLIRLQALNEVAGKDTTLQLAQLLLFLFFLLIECLPVTVKLMQKPGNYEKILKLVTDKEFWDARGRYTAPYTRGAGGESNPAGPETDIHDVWYGQEPGQEQFLPRRPASPQQPPPQATMTDHQPMPAPDDTALREMEDIRVPPTTEAPERPGRIQLFTDDEDF